jgi:hypothetical protein
MGRYIIGTVGIFGTDAGAGLRGGMTVRVWVGVAGRFFDRVIKEAPDKNRMTQQPTTMERTIKPLALERENFFINPYASRLLQLLSHIIR